MRNLLDKQGRLRQYFGRTPISVVVGDTPTVSRENVFVAKARAIVQAHLADSAFNVEQFSAALNMSGRQVVRKLKALTGQTAVEFIRNQRLERAVQLLGEDKSVSEVAYACVIRKFALIYEGVRGEILGATLGLRTRS